MHLSYAASCQLPAQSSSYGQQFQASSAQEMKPDTPIDLVK